MANGGDDGISREERLQGLLDVEERDLKDRTKGMRSATDRYMRADRLRDMLSQERSRSRRRTNGRR